MRAPTRKRRRPAPPPSKPSRLREFAGWASLIVFVGIVLAWSVWRAQPENMLRPVAAHSTPHIDGRCAVDLRTGLVWGKIMLTGGSRGNMGVYVVRSLSRRYPLTEVPMDRVRVVPCEDVTGPKKLDYGTRAP